VAKHSAERQRYQRNKSVPRDFVIKQMTGQF